MTRTNPPPQEAAFWHCNQLIRGLYQPFLAEWHAAFHDHLLVLRVEDLMDAPVSTHERLRSFLRLSSPSLHAPRASHRSYASTHAASLNVSCCGGGRGPPQPMLQQTRALLLDFYRPFNVRLTELLHDASFGKWDALSWGGLGSPVVVASKDERQHRHQRRFLGSDR